MNTLLSATGILPKSDLPNSEDGIAPPKQLIEDPQSSL